jgi:hypothetical protein
MGTVVPRGTEFVRVLRSRAPGCGNELLAIVSASASRRTVNSHTRPCDKYRRLTDGIGATKTTYSAYRVIQPGSQRESCWEIRV